MEAVPWSRVTNQKLGFSRVLKLPAHDMGALNLRVQALNPQNYGDSDGKENGKLNVSSPK